MSGIDSTSLWDTVALLNLFQSVTTFGGQVDGALKAQKLTFLAELKAKERHLRAGHFRFFRYTFGPYSGHLATSIGQLERAGVVTKSGLVTKRGRYILDYAREDIGRSERALEAVDVIRSTGQKFAKKTGTALKEYVYTLTVPVAELGDKPMRVKDIPIGFDIIDPAREVDLEEVGYFSEDVLEEIGAELSMPAEKLRANDPSYRRTVTEALKRAAITSSEKQPAIVS